MMLCLAVPGPMMHMETWPKRCLFIPAPPGKPSSMQMPLRVPSHSAIQIAQVHQLSLAAMGIDVDLHSAELHGCPLFLQSLLPLMSHCTVLDQVV